MKLQSKGHIFSLLFVMILTFILTSCNRSPSIDLVSEDTMLKLDEKLEKVIPADASVTKITVSTPVNSFSREIDKVSVYYYEANSDSMKMMHIRFGPEASVTDKTKLLLATDKLDKAADGVKINEVVYNGIIDNVQKASDIMVEIDRPVSGLGTYTIKPNKDPKKRKALFTILSEVDKTMVLKNGRTQTDTQYEEIKFEANNDGEVKMLK